MLVWLKFWRHFHMSNKIGLVFLQLQQFDTSQSLNNSRDITVGQSQQFQHFGIDTHVIEVCTNRLFRLWVTLTKDTYQCVVLLSHSHYFHAGFTTYQYRRYHTREQDYVTYREYGKGVGNLHTIEIAIITFYIGNH